MLSIMDLTSYSASQRILFLPELLTIILRDLGRADLARMARLSSFTHHAAIQLLWEGSGDYRLWQNLIRLFPPGLVKERENDEHWIFTRPPEEHDWARFRHYSVYAKYIRIKSSYPSRESFDFFRNRSNERFPRLRFLGFDWIADVNYYKTCEWFVLAGPTLRRLWIQPTWGVEAPALVKGGLDQILSLLQELPLRTPHLTSIALPCFSEGILDDASTHRLAKLLSSALQSLHDLKDVSWLWPALPNTAVQMIAMHPTLTSVGLSNAPLYTPTSKLELFPTIKSLEFKDGDAGTLASLLGSLSRPDRLERISPTIVLKDDPNKISSLSHAFSFLAPAIRLTHVDIVLQGYTADANWGCFRPLLQCSSMIEFDIYTNTDVGIDDEEILELAKSWVDLESLGIVEEFVKDGEDVPRLTLLGLANLAKHSPKLTSISISVSLRMNEYWAATAEIVEEFLRSEFSSSSNVDTLDLAYSRFEIDDIGKPSFLAPRAVARLIRRLFPAVDPDKVQHAWYDDPLEGERWGYVKDLLWAMTTAEEEENRRLEEAESHQADITSLTRERDKLVEECANLRRMLDARGNTNET